MLKKLSNWFVRWETCCIYIYHWHTKTDVVIFNDSDKLKKDNI